MKKFYLLLLLIPLFVLSAFYFPMWWSIAAVGGLLAFIAYRYFAERVESADTRNKVLETDIEDLHQRLEQSFFKEQKTAKETVQVRQSKQQLLSILSHEIRTPMNGVIGTTLLLTDTELTKEQREYVNTIQRCSEGLLTTINAILVNDILDFSKLQEEAGTLEYKAFDLRDGVEEVLELFAGKTNKAGITLLYYIEDNVPAQIIGDSKRVRQVLTNLVENAVKYTSSGEVFVHIKNASTNRSDTHPYLTIEVRDTGIGIAENQLKQLFKGIPGKDFQKQKEQQDTGLGLVICKRIVELMGGNIGVTSKQGSGSTFTVNIPLTPGLKPTYQQAMIDNLSALENKRVLIIEENATQRDVLIKQLTAWKMIAVSAIGTEQAMAAILADAEKIDLVIVSLTMTTINGLQFAGTVRKQYSSLPIIGLHTAGDTRHEQQPPMFSAMITKPIRQHILKDKVIGVFGPPAMLNENSMSELFALQYPLRILVAEDNNINQKIALKILEKLGYTADLANDGKEVMEMVDQTQYDIILMDVQMPEMNGLEATRLIRTCLEIQPVIIAVTANAMQGDRDECMQAGMDDYMSKPIELNELIAQLEKWAIVIRNRKKLSA
jgi:signal transduction histidine kinase/CheY-like chemotaxis protein